jgi:hypothetical protein
MISNIFLFIIINLIFAILCVLIRIIYNSKCVNVSCFRFKLMRREEVKLQNDEEAQIQKDEETAPLLDFQ